MTVKSHLWMTILGLVIVIHTSQATSLHSEHHDASFDVAQPLLIYSDRPFDAMMMDAMARMHHGMIEAGHTGDPNIDFVQQMIPHHQGAIDMVSILTLFEPQDKQIRNLSSQILAVQTAEITEMRQWLASYHPASSELAEHSELSHYNQASSEIMEQMHHAMEQADQNGDPSYDFITMMIPHHQGAIDMAEAYLNASDDPRLTNLAHRIITEQQLEIVIMRQWLAEYPKD